MRFFRNTNSVKRWGIGHLPVKYTNRRITLIWCGPVFILAGVK